MNEIANYRLSDNTRHRTIVHEGIVVLQSEGEVIVVNEIATKVIEAITSGQTSSELTERLLGEHDIDSHQLWRDIGHFLKEMMELRIIEQRTHDNI